MLRCMETGAKMPFFQNGRMQQLSRWPNLQSPVIVAFAEALRASIYLSPTVLEHNVVLASLEQKF